MKIFKRVFPGWNKKTWIIFGTETNWLLLNLMLEMPSGYFWGEKCKLNLAMHNTFNDRSFYNKENIVDFLESEYFTV